MKYLCNLFLSAIVFMLVGITFCSCGTEEFEGDVIGTAMLAQRSDDGLLRVRTVRPGDRVLLKIGATTELGTELNIVTISRTVYAPDVHYLIDGEEVGVTRDYESFFSFEYEVKDLAPGEHTLSVDIPQMYKNIYYNIDVRPSIFVVKPLD